MSNLNKMVAARRAKTGESYSVALRRIRAQAPTVDQAQPSPLDEHLAALDEARHDGDVLTQQVLTGPWNITYWLNNDQSDVGFSIGGAGPAPLPGWVLPTAKRYARMHRALLIDMLKAARYGDFHVARGGVVAGWLQTDQGEISAWFTSWNDDRPVMNRTHGLTYDVAQAIAVAAFRDVPEEVRKRLFRIARPWEAESAAGGATE